MTNIGTHSHSYVQLVNADSTDSSDKMARRSNKMKILILGALIFTFSWMGYWIGVVTTSRTHSSKDLIAHMDQQAVVNKPAVGDSDDFHVLRDEEARKRLGAKLSQDQQGDADHVYLIGKKGHKDNVADNAIHADMLKDHADKVHQGHAGRISQSINKKNTEKKTRDKDKISATAAPAVSTVPVPTFNGPQDYYVLMHGSGAARVHSQIHAHVTVMEEHIPKEYYVFEANRLPKDLDFLPSIANGKLGTRIHSKEMYMNGVYNGYQRESHRAGIPSTVSMNITSTEPPSNFTRTYILNVGEGIYTEKSVSKYYTIDHRVYAHRNETNLLVIEVDLIRKAAIPLKLKVELLSRWTTSYDFTIISHPSNISETSYKECTINSPETDRSKYTKVHVVYDHIPEVLEAPKDSARCKWIFLTAVGRTRQEAFAAYQRGASRVKSGDQLYADHVNAWGQLWKKGRIDLEGDTKTARAVYGSMYYLLSSLPTQRDYRYPYIGLSPGGLPFGGRPAMYRDYMGHVFWDQETWMYPTILMLFPDLGKLLLDTRTRTMEAAKENARLHHNQGIRYPWESAYTGIETSPSHNCSDYEIHINGDIAFAVLQYLYATKDKTILEKEEFGKMLYDIALFWVSVLKLNETKGKYEIKDVMPPDEYAVRVNNSVYTNTVAQLSMRAFEYARQLLNASDHRFDKYADNLYIPYDTERHYHPEYEGYHKGTQIKQADAVLLGYPLMRDISPEIQKNDLMMYTKVTDRSGPAMTWSMYAIGWLQVGQFDKAASDFNKSFQYIQGDFEVWTEQPQGQGCRNFLTGMGGFLQSVFFGYGGFRLTQTHLEFNPVMAPKTTSMDFIGVDYLGYTLNFYVHKDSMLLKLEHKQDRAVGLHVLIMNEREEIYDLNLKQSFKSSRQKVAIYPANAPIPEV